MRLSLHPQGLAPRIVNLGAWRAYLLARLQRDIQVSGDAQLQALWDELNAYPGPVAAPPADTDVVLMPLQFASEQGVISLIGTTTVFGTANDITLAELALETFFPADAFSAQYLRDLAEKAHLSDEITL